MFLEYHTRSSVNLISLFFEIERFLNVNILKKKGKLGVSEFDTIKLYISNFSTSFFRLFNN